MAENTIGWGQGATNNTINWGLGAVNNGIGWGIIHSDGRSWSGETEIYGISYFVKNYRDRVIADSGTIESVSCVDRNLDLASNPVITLLGDAIVLSRVDTTYSDAGATANDDIFFGDITSRLVTDNGVDQWNAGVYEVKYNVEDLSGRAATEVTRQVYITSNLVNRFEDRVDADLGTHENLQCLDFDYGIDWDKVLLQEDNYNELISRYTSRISADLGTLETTDCINRRYYSQFNWDYNYRVLDDGGIVEKIGCTTY